MREWRRVAASILMKKRLILVDGTAVLYRAYFAIPSLSTRAGRPTNAVYGFIRMLQQLNEAWHPTHLAVVLDGGLPRERLELMPDYKAQRPRMPDALREQIPLAQEYMDKARIAWLRLESQEADDVMASLAGLAKPEAAEILIASSDKDMYQIVDEKIKLAAIAGKGGLMGPEDVLAKTGVEPSQVVEWLALAGDNADNIPGAPGVGPKTAAGLLRRYGSLSALWTHLDELPGDKLRSALRENKTLVERNTRLIRLRQDAVGRLDWNVFEARPPPAEKLVPFLEELEFDSMVRGMREKQQEINFDV